MGSHERLHTLVRHYLERGDTVMVGLLNGTPAPLAGECDLALQYPRLHFLNYPTPVDAARANRIVKRRTWFAHRFKIPPVYGLSAWEKVLYRLQGHTALLQALPIMNVEMVRQWLYRSRPDAVMLVYIHTAYLIPVIRASRFRPKLVMLDSIDVQSIRQTTFHTQGLAHWVSLDRESELHIADLADLVIAIQANEAAFFKDGLRQAITTTMYHSHPTVHLPAAETCNILFAGGPMEPNRLGIERFLNACWPRVLDLTEGNARLRIAGKVCDVLPAIDIPGVTRVGFVNDLQSEYRQAAVVIAPIEFGGGLKIKVVEALCHGKAVVTTPCGSEGLPPSVPEAFITVTSPEHMAQAIATLLNHPDDRHLLEARAISFAEKTFAEQACFKATDDAIEQWLQSSPPSKRKRSLPTLRKKRAILFGTGTGGENGYLYLRHIYDIIGFCDNNRDKHGTEFRGRPVHSPTELNTLTYDRIVICSMHKDSIRAQLCNEQKIPIHSIEVLNAGICSQTSRHK